MKFSRWVSALLLASLASVAYAGFMSIGAGGGAVAPGGGSSGGAAWADRCADADLHCVPFDNDSDITAWLLNGNGGGGNLQDPTRADTDSNLASFQPDDGCMGNGAVQMEDSDGTDESQIYLSIQTWPSATSAANITSASDIQHVIGVGDTVYAQFCWRPSQALIDSAYGWSGHKIVSFTGAYNSNTYQEAFFMRNAERHYTSVSNSNSVVPWYYTDIGGGNYNMQPGSTYGNCYYATEPTGCYVLDDVWYSVRMRLTPGAKNTPTTHITVEIAKRGDSAYTKIYDRSDLESEDYQDDGPGGAEGYSAFLLWDRHENHDSQPRGISQKFSNLALSTTEPVLPDWTEWPSAPSWFTGATADRWGVIPGTNTTTLDTVSTYADVADGTNNPGAYSGMSAYGTKLWFCGGGHALSTHNECYYNDISGSSATWVQAMTGSSSNCEAGGVADCGTNTTGKYGDGSRASDHNYSHLTAVGDDTLWFPMMGSAKCSSCGGGAFRSTAVWKWKLADVATRQGYTYVGNAIVGSMTGMNTEEGCGAFEKRGVGRVWGVTQNGYQTPNPVWYINLATEAITTVGPYTNLGGSGNGAEETSGCAVIPNLNVLAVITDANRIKLLDLDALTWTACTFTGTFNPSDVRVKHPVYSPAANQLFIRQDGDGNSIRYATVPATKCPAAWTTGTSSAASGGTNVPDTVEGTDAGPYSRELNIIPDFMGTGDDLLLYWPEVHGPVYFQRIDGPRAAVFEPESAINDAYYDKRLAA